MARAKPLKIHSTYALLDVKRGRKGLATQLTVLKCRSGEHRGIPVIIEGFINDEISLDDGTSIEFGVEVTSVKLGRAR